MLFRRRAIGFRGGLDLVLPRAPLGFGAGAVAGRLFVTHVDGLRVLLAAAAATRAGDQALAATAPGAAAMGATRVLAHASDARRDVDEALTALAGEEI